MLDLPVVPIEEVDNLGIPCKSGHDVVEAGLLCSHLLCLTDDDLKLSDPTLVLQSNVVYLTYQTSLAPACDLRCKRPGAEGAVPVPGDFLRRR